MMNLELELKKMKRRLEHDYYLEKLEQEESENQSSATEKQPFIPPKNWGGKKEKMREQESNLPKDEDSWEMNE